MTKSFASARKDITKGEAMAIYKDLGLWLFGTFVRSLLVPHQFKTTETSKGAEFTPLQKLTCGQSVRSVLDKIDIFAHMMFTPPENLTCHPPPSPD